MLISAIKPRNQDCNDDDDNFTSSQKPRQLITGGNDDDDELKEAVFGCLNEDKAGF